MKNVNITILAFVILVFAEPLKSQELHRLTIASAVDLAKKHNTSVRNAVYDMDIARQQVIETTAQGLPQISAKISYNNNIDLPVTLVPAIMFNPNAAAGEFIELKFGTKHNASFNFQVSQLIFNGSYIVGLQTAKTFKQLSERNFQRSENEVVLTVTQTYNTILFAQKNRLILKNNLEDITKTLYESSKIFEAGLMEETNVDQFKLNKSMVENAIKSLDRQIDIQYDLLKIQAGIDIKDSIIITDSLDLVFNNSNASNAMLQSFDISKNIDYQLMRTQEEISKQQVNLEKSTLLPSLNGFYSHTQSGQSDEFNYFNKSQKWFPSNIIGASLVIPITTSGGAISRIKQAELSLRKTQNNISLLEQNLTLGVNGARNKLINDYETYLTQKENVALAEKIYKRNLEKFKQGLISSTELTQVNTQFYNSQATLYSAMLNVLNAKAEMDKILGNNL
ncbi:MAG: hypothetical protein AUJ98_03555 [Bacteroidetes bacterium CG2_30_33_31]|nr:MAG: hypothetical protein AUJ98_03555 [Bacteroidetes bacterium CG2_30_33_31]